jgi:hypothetical protein
MTGLGNKGLMILTESDSCVIIEEPMASGSSAGTNSLRNSNASYLDRS